MVSVAVFRGVVVVRTASRSRSWKEEGRKRSTPNSDSSEQQKVSRFRADANPSTVRQQQEGQEQQQLASKPATGLFANSDSGKQCDARFVQQLQHNSNFFASLWLCVLLFLQLHHHVLCRTDILILNSYVDQCARRRQCAARSSTAGGEKQYDREDADEERQQRIRQSRLTQARRR